MDHNDDRHLQSDDTGYYVSMDPPGDLSTGQCFAHSILTKESWLRDHGIEAEWPCFGVMTSIYLDNAREFRGKTLRYACEMYGIDIQWRMVAKLCPIGREP